MYIYIYYTGNHWIDVQFHGFVWVHSQSPSNPFFDLPEIAFCESTAAATATIAPTATTKHQPPVPEPVDHCPRRPSLSALLPNVGAGSETWSCPNCRRTRPRALRERRRDRARVGGWRSTGVEPPNIERWGKQFLGLVFDGFEGRKGRKQQS